MPKRANMNARGLIEYTVPIPDVHPFLAPWRTLTASAYIVGHRPADRAGNYRIQEHHVTTAHGT